MHAFVTRLLPNMELWPCVYCSVALTRSRVARGHLLAVEQWPAALTQPRCLPQLSLHASSRAVVAAVRLSTFVPARAHVMLQCCSTHSRRAVGARSLTVGVVLADAAAANSKSVANLAELR